MVERLYEVKVRVDEGESPLNAVSAFSSLEVTIKKAIIIVTIILLFKDTIIMRPHGSGQC